MKESCEHQWSEELETCRTCNGTDIVEVEIPETINPLYQGRFRVKTEPLFGSFCEKCDDLTMVSWARHCEKCGAVKFLLSMDDEISRQ